MAVIHNHYIKYLFYSKNPLTRILIVNNLFFKE